MVIPMLGYSDAGVESEFCRMAGTCVSMSTEGPFWGDRAGRIVDPTGHVWNFLGQTTTEPYAEQD